MRSVAIASLLVLAGTAAQAEIICTQHRGCFETGGNSFTVMAVASIVKNPPQAIAMQSRGKWFSGGITTRTSKRTKQMKSNNVNIPDEAIITFIAPNDFKEGSLRWRRYEQARQINGSTAKEMRALPPDAGWHPWPLV